MTIVQAALKMSKAKRVTCHVEWTSNDRRNVVHTIAVRSKQGWVIISGKNRRGSVDITETFKTYSGGMDRILVFACDHDLIGEYSDDELMYNPTNYIKFE